MEYDRNQTYQSNLTFISYIETKAIQKNQIRGSNLPANALYGYNPFYPIYCAHKPNMFITVSTTTRIFDLYHLYSYLIYKIMLFYSESTIRSTESLNIRPHLNCFLEGDKIIEESWEISPQSAHID